MDSADLQAEEAFLALGGQRFHAASFAAQVIDKGVSAIITDQAGADLIKQHTSSSPVPVVVVPHPREIASELARKAYGYPDTKLLTVAVTGTNGKTTACSAAWKALEAAGYPCAIFGTAQMKVGPHRFVSPRTTLEAPVIQRCLALALELGLKAAVIEISAHALSLHRVDGIVFDAAMFTNLQSDHLDYYGTVEQYFQAKQLLFTPEHAKFAAICVDDPWGQKLAAETKIPHLNYATYTPHPLADWQVSQIEVGKDFFGTQFRFQQVCERQAEPQATSSPSTPSLPAISANSGLTPHRQTAASQDLKAGTSGQSATATTSPSAELETDLQLQIPLPGDYNVQNLAGVFLMLHAGLAIGATQIQTGFNQVNVPGRFEVVPTKSTDQPRVIVDFAHTPEALEDVLRIVRTTCQGQIHLVFGTDGDRDATKRPGVGRAAAQGADVLWVTDENPRTEDAQSIRDQLYIGIKEIRPDLHQVTEVTTCRRDAIRIAIFAAGPQDTVLITGKGSEPYQEIDHVFHRFSDAEVAAEVLAAQRTSAEKARTHPGT